MPSPTAQARTDDIELEVWFSEMKLRACTKIGELVRELDTAEHAGPGQYEIPSDGSSRQTPSRMPDSQSQKHTATRNSPGGRSEQAGKAEVSRCLGSLRADA
jgi:hypothetical protein